jgi:hypothetical protein
VTRHGRAYRRIGASAYRRIGVSAYRRIGASAHRRIGVSGGKVIARVTMKRELEALAKASAQAFASRKQKAPSIG